MVHDRVALLLEQMDDTYEREGWFAPLAEALRGVHAAEAAWRPDPGVHTIWQLVRHMTFWAAFTCRRLQGEAPTGREIDNEGTFGAPGDPADAAGWGRTVEELRGTYRRLRSAVEHEGDADLERPLNSAGTPARQMVGGLVPHDAYHIGQIVLLRRLRGSWRA